MGADLEISEQRRALAAKVIAEKTAILSEDDIMRACDIVGDLYQCLTYDSSGRLRIAANNIQLVALAAVFAAVHEAGGVVVIEETDA